MNYLIGCNWCRLSLPYFLQIGILFAKILLFMDAYFAYCPCSTGDFPISGCDQLLQPPLIAHSIQLYDCKFQLRTPSFFGFVKDFRTKPPNLQNPQFVKTPKIEIPFHAQILALDSTKPTGKLWDRPNRLLTIIESTLNLILL